MNKLNIARSKTFWNVSLKSSAVFGYLRKVSEFILGKVRLAYRSTSNHFQESPKSSYSVLFVYIKDIEFIIQRNVSYFRTHPHTCIIPYLFSLADQVTTDGAVTHENVPHYIVFTLFTADYVLHHSREQIKSRFKSRQGEFFIFNN